MKLEAFLERKLRGWAALAGITATALLLLATAFAPGAQARVEGFQSLAPSSVPLTAVAADPSTGFVYAQENGGTAYFRYDPRTNVWTEITAAPISSGNNGGATYLGGKIYTVYTGEDEKLGVYDIASNTWTTIANPLGAGTGNITATGGKLYLAVENLFVSYDPATGITTLLAAPPIFSDPECENGFEEWGGLQPVGGKIYGHQGNGCNGFAVYDIAANSWLEQPLAPEVENEEGPLLGSAYNPLTNTYITYGPYGGKVLYRFDIEAGSWSTGTLPFEVDDGGMAFISIPGIEGIYMIQGEEGTGFVRYSEHNQADVSPSISASVKKGGLITYTILVKNSGPERAGGVVLSNPLPAGAKLISTAASQGACTGTTTLSCGLGALKAGASASLGITVKSRSKNVITSTSVTSLAIETVPANDSATNTTKQCVVPKVKKRSVKAAKKALRKANCKPGKKLGHRFSGKIKEGKVIRSKKGKGAVLPAGSRVRLTVSRGPKG